MAAEQRLKEETDKATGKGLRIKNWSGNLEYSTSSVLYPQTTAEVQEVIRQYPKLRPLGSMHSFNDIADSEFHLLSSKYLDFVGPIDQESNTITVGSGVRYGDLAPIIHAKGLALHNLGSLPHITIAGAVATATHGSGIGNGNLATAVTSIEFVSANGDCNSLSRIDGDNFNGAVVSLGALGVVTSITLQLEPAYHIKQDVYINLPLGRLREHFRHIQEGAYSVSFFTNWKKSQINQVWVKARADNTGNILSFLKTCGALPATENLHPIEGQPAENCTDQMGIAGHWHERLPHFKMGFKPSAGAELQSEYFVPVEHAYEAIMAFQKLNEKISPYLLVSEIRTIKGDDLWISPCYRQDCLAIHTTWKQDQPAVMNLLPLIEEALAPFNPKPHWGKLFTLSPAMLQARYQRLPDFKQLVRQYDPAGKFINAYLAGWLGMDSSKDFRTT